MEASTYLQPITKTEQGLDPQDWSELRQLGRRMVDALVCEARQFSLDAVFAFTYVPDFFRKMGFQEVERGELPLKAWKDCLRCPKFQCCDEIAMVQILRPEHWRDHQVQQPEIEGSVLLPIVHASQSLR